jgi:hypothetical protein
MVWFGGGACGACVDVVVANVVEVLGWLSYEVFGI